MDKRSGNSWHAVVGEGFGFEITHEMKNLLYMFFGNLGVLVWKASWRFFIWFFMERMKMVHHTVWTWHESWNMTESLQESCYMWGSRKRKTQDRIVSDDMEMDSKKMNGQQSFEARVCWDAGNQLKENALCSIHEFILWMSVGGTSYMSRHLFNIHFVNEWFSWRWTAIPWRNIADGIRPYTLNNLAIKCFWLEKEYFSDLSSYLFVII